MSLENFPIIKDFLRDWRATNKYEHLEFWFILLTIAGLGAYTLSTFMKREMNLINFIYFLAYWAGWFVCYKLVRKSTERKTQQLNGKYEPRYNPDYIIKKTMEDIENG